MSYDYTQPRTRRLNHNRRGGGGRRERAVRAISNFIENQNPLVLFIIGAAMLCCWLGASMLQIETTEAYILHGPPPMIGHADWGVLTQFYLMTTGNITGNEGAAIVTGWVIELITLGIGCCFDAAMGGVARGSRGMVGVFSVVSVILLVVNGYTDYSYGSLPSGPGGQAFFAAVVSFAVVFFLPVGLELILCAKRSFMQ